MPASLLNKARRAHGLRRLRANPHLLRPAERHSRSMVLSGFFSHVDPGGLSSLDRIRLSGFLRHARAWACGGEHRLRGGSDLEPAEHDAELDEQRAAPSEHPHARLRAVGVGVVPGVPGGAGTAGGTYTTDFGFRS